MTVPHTTAQARASRKAKIKKLITPASKRTSIFNHVMRGPTTYADCLRTTGMTYQEVKDNAYMLAGKGLIVLPVKRGEKLRLP
jgi:predicted Rossmann fold nucleotide-binding protein DprA/Smf involved in DNA uptake